MAENAKRKINWIWIVLAAVIVVLVVVIVYQASCTGGEETTTTTVAQAQIPPGTQVVRLTEASNGKTVTVSPGFLLILELTGYPTRGYQWNVVPPDPEVVKGLPGPEITPDSGDTPGTYLFAGLALALGTTEVSADYVSPQGQTENSYKLTIQVVSSTPTSSTTTTGRGDHDDGGEHDDHHRSHHDDDGRFDHDDGRLDHHHECVDHDDDRRVDHIDHREANDDHHGEAHHNYREADHDDYGQADDHDHGSPPRPRSPCRRPRAPRTSSGRPRKSSPPIPIWTSGTTGRSSTRRSALKWC